MKWYHTDLLHELQIQLGFLATPAYCAELTKYHVFFETITSSMGPMDLYHCMRDCGIYKLYDEPHTYEHMDAHIILDGILGKHLRDLVALVSFYHQSSGPRKSVIETRIRNAIQIFPTHSPCLDAYTTELDRLVRIVTTPIESSNPSETSPIDREFTLAEDATDYEVAATLLRLFHSSVRSPSEFTCESFQAFLRKRGVYGNPVYHAVLIPSFVELSNLVEQVYQIHDLCTIVCPSTFDEF